MLSKVNRLHQKRDFDLVFKKGKSLKSNFLICKILKNNLQRIRVGFIVSKKVSPKATVRNKVKRKLRAAALSALTKNNTSNDIVIIALPAIKDKEFLEIQETISHLFKIKQAS